MKVALLLPVAFLALATPDSCGFSRSQETREGTPTVMAFDSVSGPEADVQAIKEASDKLLQAFKDQDLETVIAGMTDDIVLIPQGAPIVKGKEAVRVFYRSQFDEYRVVDIGPSLDELVVNGDWAFTRGTAAVLVRPRNNEHDHDIKVYDRGLEIWKRSPDGQWLLARATGNH